jgi:uncharacterized membrane protein
MEISSEILQHIRIEMLAIVPVLVIIGKILKDSARCKDKHIPAILTAVSIAVSIGWIFIYTNDKPAQAVLDGVIQGVLLAGAAVYGNQLFKQVRKKDE